MKYSKKRILNKEIPDENYSGVFDTIKVHRNLTVKAVEVHLDVQHKVPSELAVELTGPDGLTVTLDGPGKDTGKDLIKQYSGDVLTQFVGKKSAGNWSLRVIDTSKSDVGMLNHWTLHVQTRNSKKSEIFFGSDTAINSTQVCHSKHPISEVKIDVTTSKALDAKAKLILESPAGTEIALPVDQSRRSVSYHKQLQKLVGESPKGKWKLSVVSQTNVQLERWKLNLKTLQNVPLAQDDLTKIEGIGPKIKGLLYAGGIKTFSKLADTEIQNVKAILDAAGPRYQMHDPSSWPRQSQLAANGKWDELAKLQDILDGGK